MIIVSFAVYAQQEQPAEGPSVPDTVDYINKKLALCGERGQDIRFRQPDTLEITGTDIAYWATEESNWGETEWSEPSNPNSHVVRFRLRDLMIDVERSEFQNKKILQTLERITVSCAMDDCMDVVQLSERKEGWSSYSFISLNVGFYDREKIREFNFFVCDDDSGPRVEKALEHAIRLSGGKEQEEELF